MVSIFVDLDRTAAGASPGTVRLDEGALEAPAAPKLVTWQADPSGSFAEKLIYWERTLNEGLLSANTR